MSPLTPANVGLRGDLAEGLQKGLSHVEVFSHSETHDSTGPNYDVVDTVEPCVLLALELGTDNEGGRVDLDVRNPSGTTSGTTTLRIIHPGVSASRIVTPNELNQAGGSAFWDLARFDDAGDNYLIHLAVVPLYAPTGLRARVNYASVTASAHIALNAIVGFFA